MKMIPIVFDDRQEKREETEGEREIREFLVVRQVAEPGGRIVRHQQVLAIGIQSKILFLRPRGRAPQTSKDLIGLCLRAASIFTSLRTSNSPPVPPISTKPFILSRETSPPSTC